MAEHNDLNNPLVGGRKLVVLICTVRRPQMLADCLKSVLDQEIPDGWTFEVGIVENDSEPRSRSVVEGLAAKSPVPVHYVLEPRRGIPFARNRTIELALEREADWLVLIDDDEAARPGWLTALIAAQQEHGAAVVKGRVEPLYEVPVPDWWFRPKRSTMQSGRLLKDVASNNTIFSAKLVRADGLNLRFHEALVSGGEDTDFFRRAHAAGAMMVYTREAVVEEKVPASRLTARRLLDRVQTQAANLAFAERLRNGNARAVAHLGVNGVVRVCTGGLLALAALPFYVVGIDEGRRIMFRGLKRLFKGYGNLRGLTPYRSNYYSRIDGR